MNESALQVAMFWASAVVVVYAYAGYPVALAICSRARRRPGPTGEADGQPTATVLLVAHDEEETIGSKIDDCLEQDYPAEKLDVLVVSDGSRDATDDIVRGRSGPRVALRRVAGPAGKAAALNQSVADARGAIVVLCDARQRLRKDAVRNLVARLGDPEVGAVSGELRIDEGAGLGRGVGLYWRMEKAIRKLEASIDSVVGATGALYAIRRSLFRPIDPRTILDDVSIPMQVVRAGYRVVFEPEAVAYDRSIEDPRREFRRKLRTLAGNLQLLMLQPWLLNPRENRLWWQFVSHKLLRLLVPWSLIAVAYASAGRTGLYGMAWHLQVAFYAAAMLGWLLQAAGLPNRPFAAPYAFVLLNLAAGAAPFGLLFGVVKPAWKAGERSAPVRE